MVQIGGQHFGLEYLIPLALERLRADPLGGGLILSGRFTGRCPPAASRFWRNHSEVRNEAAEIVERAFASLPTLEEIDRRAALGVLAEAQDRFKKAEATA